MSQICSVGRMWERAGVRQAHIAHIGCVLYDALAGAGLENRGLAVGARQNE